MQKYPKLTFLDILSNNSIVKYPTAKLITITKEIIIGSSAKIDPSPKIKSTATDATTTGTDIKKLNFNALSCSYFSPNMVDTVTPDRKMPGRIANP